MENNGNNICTECVSLAHLTEENSECQCDYNSFGFKNLACYKCDDENYGNPGCEAEEGCEYRPQNEQINCHKCKSGFYEYTYGQCFPCSKELEFCNKCHLDENSQFICDGCEDNFIYNKYEKICELNCQENPYIPPGSPGCIICNEEYKSKRKCNACKPGYFMLDDETCVNCRSEDYAGPACDRCGTDENNGFIICVSCEGRDKVLNSIGQCYFAPLFSVDECSAYKFKVDGNEEKIVCAFCNDGFYLDSTGNCVNFLEYLEIKDNCYSHEYHFGKLSIKYYNEKIEYYVYEYGIYISSKNAYEYNETVLEYVNSDLRKIDHLLTGDCYSCDYGYLLNAENQCIPVTIEMCSIISIVKDSNKIEHCLDFCEIKQYPLLLLNINNENDEPSYVTISEIYNKVFESKMFLSEIKSLLQQTICIDNSNNDDLKNCLIAKYLEQDNKYVCYLCHYDYFLNEETNKCVPFDNNNCIYENIGTETNPILSCKKCRPNYYYINYYNYFYGDIFSQTLDSIYHDDTSDYIMAKEGNVNICVYPQLELENCLSATVDTTYATNKYNCTACLINYLPYYSKFYERCICQSIFDEIKTSQSYDTYNDFSLVTRNGACPDNTYFSPDGIFCYECNSNSGMPGCKSQCSFSLERKNSIKCLDGCIEGYIEDSEGICRSCNEINTGCEKCHYEEYPTDYLGIKRKRKFVCDSCEYEHYLLKDGECTPCYYYEDECNLCEMKNNEFKCKECNPNALFDSEGHCISCTDGYIFDNRCIKCNDKNGGGMEGCQYCHNNQSQVTCEYCEEGYILLKNNETCLKISENPELIKHNKCRDIILENNKFQCVECNDDRFSVFNANGESICIYLPELNGYKEDYFYFEEPSDIKNHDINYIYLFYYNNYILNYFDHCSEVINLGTEDVPIYSCLRCKYFFELYKEENTNISYCIDHYYINYLENCEEMKFKIIDKKIKFTCTSCIGEKYIPVYHEIDRVNYCLDSNDTSCMAKNCKTCREGDNYFCEICEYENYVVNEITGACVEKIESVPDITWKDIFRLELNSEKEINGKTIKGPKLNLRGRQILKLILDMLL